jgi:hypothetical protein
MSIRALLLGVALAATTLHAALACQGTKVLFQDRFKSLGSAWVRDGARDENASASGGRLRVHVPISGGDLADHLLHQSKVFGNVDECITLQFTAADDPSSASAGIAFWGMDDNHYYMLVISPTGQYIVMRKVAAFRNLWPIGWTSTSALRQGLYASNELEIITQGNRAVFYINGVQVNELDEGEPPASGSLVGVYWATQPNHNMQAEFSDLKVMR